MRSVGSISPSLHVRDQHHADAYGLRPPRQRAFLNGRLVYGDGAFTLDCSIRDISIGGAKVVLTKSEPLPADVYLIIVKYCVAHRARIVWMKFPARGLKFSETYQLGATLPEELGFLRQLWLDLDARSGSA